MVFFKETEICCSPGLIKQTVIVSFENNPIVIKFKKSKNLFNLKFSEIDKITLETNKKSKYQFIITIFYVLNTKMKQTNLYFSKKEEFFTWRIVLNLLFRNKNINSADKLIGENSRNNLLSKTTSVIVKNSRKLSETITSSKTTQNLSQKSNSISGKSQHNNSMNIYSFGQNDWGQLLLNSKASKIIEPKISFPLISETTKLVACGLYHSVVLLTTNKILMVGNRTATGLEEDLTNPKKIEYKHPCEVIEIYCGLSHSILLDENGKVYTWGLNFHGQLGHGENVKSLEIPQEVISLSKHFIVQISAGENFNVCLNEKGKVFTWGQGISGQLGHGDYKDQFFPKMIDSIKSVQIDLICAGHHHAIAVKNEQENNDTVFYSWGWNACGQLGLGDKTDRNVPTKSTSKFQGQAIALSCGGAHSAAISELQMHNNFLYMWGSNISGQLGLPITAHTETLLYPTIVPLFANPILVCCGLNHSALLSSENGVFMTGCNFFCQLGFLDLSINAASTAKEKNTVKNSKKNRSKIKSFMADFDFDSEMTAMSNMTEISAYTKTHKSVAKSFVDEGAIDKIEKISEHLNLEVPSTNVDQFVKVLSLDNKNAIDVVCGYNYTMSLSLKKWLDDNDVDTCMGEYSSNCKMKFSVMNRRHHCRKCGGIYCSQCCPLNSDFSDKGKAIRICLKCTKFLMAEN